MGSTPKMASVPQEWEVANRAPTSNLRGKKASVLQATESTPTNGKELWYHSDLCTKQARKNRIHKFLDKYDTVEMC